ncbi:MAG: VCBS repeat-containing protein [Alphaproteobacteria bacterium]|nr:VCBS repeat-containing protein [Alphaproteobacteria bacterium]
MATLIGQLANVSYDGWRLTNNAWNVGSLVYGQDYSVTTTYNPADLVNGTTFNWQFPAATAPYVVHAYPEMLFGASPKWGGTNPTDPNQVFPIALSNLQSLTANYNLSLSGYTQGDNVAYEMWLTSVPGGGNTTITNEIMIWFHKGEFNPCGSVIGTYSDPNFSGTVYNQHNTGDGITAPTQWNYTAIVANSDNMTGTVDIAAIIHDLENRGIITGSPYLASVDLGAEVAEGQGSLTVNSLNYNIQTTNGANTVLGGYQVASGDNTYTGVSGIQTAVFFGQRSAYTITRDGNITTVCGPDGTHTLQGIEKAAFVDQTVALGQGPLSADFNVDNNSDVLLQNGSTGQVAVWTMNGTGPLASTTVSVNPGSSWHAMAAADFNGDGNADILWQNNNGQTAIWLMKGTTRIASAAAGPNLGTAWHIAGTGDFNGDGKADILWQNASTGQVEIWLMDGTTQIASGAVGTPLASSWHIVGTGDFNGDGKSDILWQNDNGQAEVWFMDGTNVTSSGLAGPNPGSSWHIVGTGDFNGDGNADILWQNNNGQADIWLMKGLTRLSGGAAGPNLGSLWHVAGTGDYNGDGKSDILWENNNAQFAVWTMNGTSPLLTSPFSSSLGTSWHVATGA